MAVLTVDLGDRSYPIHVDAGLLKRGELIREFIVVQRSWWLAMKLLHHFTWINCSLH